MGIRTGEQAIQAALKVTSGYAGMCLRFVRVCYDAPAVYPTAIAAWNADGDHPETNPAKIPRGVPVYWAADSSNGNAGHVGISLGNGQVRHALTTNRIATTTIASATTARLLGWSSKISGISIPGLTTQEDEMTPAERNLLARAIMDYQVDIPKGNWPGAKKESVRTKLFFAHRRAEQNHEMLKALDKRLTALEKKVK